MRSDSVRSFVGFVCLLGMSLASCSQTGSATLQATSTALPTTPMLPATSTQQPSPTAIPPTATITHLVSPGEPGRAQLNLTDVNASSSASNGGVVLGDRYESNRFERPFASAGMSYLPDVDLTGAEIAHDDTWFYITLTLAGGSAGGELPVSYAVELDQDLDGRGDILIVALRPESQTWSTSIVQVYTDANGDVGGISPLQADAPPTKSDGYETRLFDAGVGDDPDLAWVRLDPAAEHGIQLAFKQTVLSGDSSFLWGVWSFSGSIDPSMFDLNDQATLAEAGSPVIGSTYYPLGEIAQVDNSCRMYYGFTPTGSEPGLCSVTGTVRNCAPHPMLMVPGNQLLPPYFENGSTLQNVIIGTYTFYDQSVEGHPAVLTAQLVPGGQIQITKTGFGDNYPCQ